MFTNEDYADYVLCITNMYENGDIRISKNQLIDCINFYYYRFCHARRLIPQDLVPIRSVERMFLPFGDFFDSYL